MDDKTKDYIVELYKAHSTVEISKMIGVSAMTVSRVLRQKGVDTSFKKNRIALENGRRDECIRYDYLQGNKDKEKLSKKYNLSVSSINYILSAARWKDKPTSLKDRIKQAIIDSEAFRESLASIARRFGVSRQYVHNVKKEIEKEGVT